MIAHLYYYDADSKTLKRWAEGTLLRAVRTLRTMVGIALAFDADGYVVGALTDDGQYQPFPEGVRGRRHISQYGTEIPLRPKPDQLNALPDPTVRGDLRVRIRSGAECREVPVRVIETRLGSKTLAIGGDRLGGTWARDIDAALVAEWRRRIAEGKEWVVDPTGRAFGMRGPVSVGRDDLVSILLLCGKEYAE